MMSLDQWHTLAERLLLYGAAASATFFVCYLWVARAVWWRTLAGAAILISATAIALLLNLEIVLSVVDASPRVDIIVTTVVLGLIDLGVTFKLAALAWDWWHARRTPRAPLS